MNGVAYAMSGTIFSPVDGIVMGQSVEWIERTVKYMANRPAKNISSLESQTIVPTLTTFGRVRECTWPESKRAVGAVDVTPEV